MPASAISTYPMPIALPREGDWVPEVNRPIILPSKSFMIWSCLAMPFSFSSNPTSFLITPFSFCFSRNIFCILYLTINLN